MLLRAIRIAGLNHLGRVHLDLFGSVVEFLVIRDLGLAISE